MNTKFERIHAEWLKAFDLMSQSKGFQRIRKGEINEDHYAEILKQLFHQVREHPQALAVLTSKLRGPQRELVKPILQHALSECGHDQLALNDLRTLGVDVSQLPLENPLPQTSAMLGFLYYLLEHRNPLGFLGYLFHLEFLPTYAGEMYMKTLETAGITRESMTFLADHHAIDVAHNQLMQKYIDRLLLREEDVEEVIFATKSAAILYGEMITAAIDNVDRQISLGLSSHEMPWL